MKQIRSLLLAVLVLSACGGGSVLTLEVGTCFDDPEGSEISTVPEVDCSEPHDNEVFAVFDYTETDTYPGSTELSDSAQALCIEEFEAYVGLSYPESALDVLPIYPSQESWVGGDREVICALYNLDLSKLTGSMQGAAR